VLDVSDETHNAIASLKASEDDFVSRNRNQPRKRDTHGVVMKHGDANQGQPEQTEIDRDAEQSGILPRHYSGA
jgi:hypothetical protein